MHNVSLPENTLECRKTNPINRRTSPVRFVHVEHLKNTTNKYKR